VNETLKISDLRIVVTVVLLVSLVSSESARADDLVWATGRVISAADKRPVAEAAVAVFDDKGRVVDFARTDADGNYALTIPRGALHLDKNSPDFLHQVTGGVSRLVGGMAGTLKYGVRAAAGASGFTDPITKAGVGMASGLTMNALDGLKPGKGKAPPPPGSVIMKVSRPGLNDAISRARVYWMETEIHVEGKKETRGMAAWFDTAVLARAGAQERSKIESEYLTFTDARLEPSIAEPGQTVTLMVDFPSPPEPETPVVVVARNLRTGKLIELEKAGDGKYRAEIKVDKKSPKFDEPITIIAYAEQADKPGRSKHVEDALNHGGFWDPAKPFVYNPLTLVSRNRAEIVLTVVEAGKKKR
jgi:hypothetical protein